MSLLSISVFFNVLFAINLCILIYTRWRCYKKLNQVVQLVKDTEINLAGTKTILASKRRDTSIAEDRAKRNQERWIKFRYDMVKAHAFHKFCLVEADSVVAAWEESSDQDRDYWMKQGHDYVEQTYGHSVG